MTDTHVPHLARRMADIEAFQVMDLLARARELEGQGRDIVHMEIGEPDFPTPEPITAATRRALAEGKTHYTPALGLPALRGLGFDIPLTPQGAFYIMPTAAASPPTADN